MAKKHIRFGSTDTSLCNAKGVKFVDPIEATCRGCLLVLNGDEGGEPNWERQCTVCGQRPVVPFSGLCGPCTFGEADTAGGNW